MENGLTHWQHNTWRSRLNDDSVVLECHLQMPVVFIYIYFSLEASLQTFGDNKKVNKKDLSACRQSVSRWNIVVIAPVWPFVSVLYYFLSIGKCHYLIY